MRQDLTARINKILHSQNIDDLDIERPNMDQVVANDPMNLAADCFKETFMEVGIDEDSAETARTAFLNMKKSSGVVEENQSWIMRMASKLSNKSSKKSSKQIDIIDAEEQSQEVADGANNKRFESSKSVVSHVQQRGEAFDSNEDEEFKYDLQ